MASPVGDQCHHVPAEDDLDQLGGTPLLVALEVGDDSTADSDVEIAGQPGQPASVLCRDHVGADQHLPEPGRGVGGVAERGTEQDQAPSFGHFTHEFVSFIDCEYRYQGRRTPPDTLAAYDRRVTSASTAQSPSADPTRMVEVTGEPSTNQEPTAPHASGGGLSAVVRRRFATVDTQLDRFSWLATAVVVAIAAILRFVGLSSPKGKIFDETYYAKDAYGLISRGVEWNYKDNGPSYVVHPPLGKWLIGLGEWAFGYQDVESKVSVPGHLITTAPEFGWRFSAAVIGTLSVLLLVRIGRRMFRSTVLGCAAGLLLALDGFHLVLSRAALLDIFLLFFVLAAFGALVLDRDARRRRWARALDDGLDPSQSGRAGRPPTGWRTWPWWRLAAGVLLGCACAVKWSALYFVPAFALLVLLWEVGVRRSAGSAGPGGTPCSTSCPGWCSPACSWSAPTSPPGRAGCSPTTATTGSRRPTRAPRSATAR